MVDAIPGNCPNVEIQELRMLFNSDIRLRRPTGRPGLIKPFSGLGSPIQAGTNRPCSPGAFQVCHNVGSIIDMRLQDLRLDVLVSCFEDPAPEKASIY